VRLDLALIRQHPGLSRRRAQRAIEKGQVSVDGLLVREPGREVAAGALLVWDPNRRALPRARLSLPALYEDEALLIVDKPPGLLSVPTVPGAREDSALARVAAYVQRLRARRPYVRAVHRIDRDTSGALAFALDPLAAQALRALFREHRIERRYSAIVLGRPRSSAGRIDAPLADVYEGGRRRVARGGEPAHLAVTDYRVAELLGAAALLDIELGTGRQHQIRVHLAHAGTPILGDKVYGRAESRLSVRAPRQMLHARVLAFTHPLSGKPVRVFSPLPGDFERTLLELRESARRSGSPDRL
jgi:23S rRNA pseudouridine1911/1915/1917 synthase